MQKIPGALQRELETSRNVDDGPGLAAIASHGLDDFPETSDGNGEKLGGFRFQYVQGMT